MLETSASLSLHGGNLTLPIFIHTKFWCYLLGPPVSDEDDSETYPVFVVHNSFDNALKLVQKLLFV